MFKIVTELLVHSFDQHIIVFGGETADEDRLQGKCAVAKTSHDQVSPLSAERMKLSSLVQEGRLHVGYILYDSDFYIDQVFKKTCVLSQSSLINIFG